VTRSKILTSRFREMVMVTLKDGLCFTGILYSCDDKALVLRRAEAVGHGENGTNAPVDGEIILFNADVHYINRP
jgi:small nuclear ribonucleoprotein (snRNP)-like protein